MSPYSCSCQADIVDGSGEGRGTADICRQFETLLQQRHLINDTESCRTVAPLIITASIHRHMPCRAISALTETTYLCRAKTMLSRSVAAHQTTPYITYYRSVSFSLYKSIPVSHPWPSI